MSDQTRHGSLIEDARDILSQTGIQFAVDAWENKAPEDYGVVELTGEHQGEWADGEMIDQSFVIQITVYVSGNSQAVKDLIQQKLKAMGASWWSLTDHRYLQDIKKNMWQWRANVYDPLEWTEPVTGGG